MAKKKSKSEYFLRRMTKHLRGDPARMEVIEQTFALYQRSNLHLAVEKLLGERGATWELEGVLVEEEYHSVSLAKLCRRETARRVLTGPVEYHDVEIADQKHLACVKRGLYWIKSPAGRFVMLVHQPPHNYPPTLRVEVMSAKRELSEDFARALESEVHQAAAFRGKVLSLEVSCDRQMEVRFHALPIVEREDIILPESVLQRIDRHAQGFAQHAQALKAAGRHLKRGILLHGAPGTGKTLCAMHLARQMTGRTVVILTGGGISSIESAGQLARSLEPVTVIVEDVDLIGTQREHQSVGASALLFELLNQMDGLAEDADVLFVLTSNRPEILEPALASRPGRIDQAIEIPLPDDDCRRRLLALYSQGLDVMLDDREKIIARTKGVSAAFIRELLRKAALLAAEENGQGTTLAVRDAHVNAALDELLVAGGVLTRTLLGVAQGFSSTPA